MQITIAHMQFIDPRKNSEKFYTVFVTNDTFVCQYGRIGTYGTFTAAKPATGAAKAIVGKLGKGYQMVRQGTVAYEGDPIPDNLAKLTTAAPLVGDSEVAMPTDREQAPVVVAANDTDDDIDPKVLRSVVFALSNRGNKAGAPSVMTGPACPQLAEIASDAQVADMLASPQWLTQFKLDGERCLIEIVDGTITVLNRSGQPKVRNVGSEMLAPFRHLTEGHWMFDGEIVGTTLHLFDMPAAGAFGDRWTSFGDRHANLETTIAALKVNPDYIKILGYATGPLKQAMFDQAEADHKEGVIFRLMSAGYHHAARGDGLMKHKFLHTVDAVVTAVGIKGKDNIAVAVHDDTTGELVNLGTVTAIGKGTFVEGDVVEIQYLYINSLEDPRLYQPRILGKRHDKAASDCMFAQVVNSVTDKTVS